MDEPFGALDAQVRWEMQEMMVEIISEQNKTVIFVTPTYKKQYFLRTGLCSLAVPLAESNKTSSLILKMVSDLFKKKKCSNNLAMWIWRRNCFPG